MKINDAYLKASDIFAIERMAGHTLDSALKDYLIKQYGYGSFYQSIWQWAKSAQDGCCGVCEICWACAIDNEDSLFVQVFKTVACFEMGVFDPKTDTYQDLCKELVFQWTRHDNPDLPF